jgi:DNA-binding CsgD family transcriptional regulator
MFYRGLRLTRREEEVFRLLIVGKTHREISRELCITRHTAREYIARIYLKLDVHSRSELIDRALSNGHLRLVFNEDVMA